MKHASMMAVVGLAALLACRGVGAEEKKSALESLADQVTQQIEQRFSPPRRPEAAVMSLEAESESLAGNSRLVQELEGLLRQRLEESPVLQRLLVISPSEGAAGLERAQRAGAGWWIRLHLGLKQRRLNVTADLMPLSSTFWQRLAGKVPAAVAHHFVINSGADEEVLTLAGQQRFEQFFGAWTISELLRRPGRYLAVAAGNLDGMEREEIVLLAADRLEIYKWKGGELKLLEEYSFDHLPQAAEVVRDPLGQLVVTDVNRDGKDEILFGSAWYRQGEILSWTGAVLHPLRRFDGIPLCVMRRAGRLHLVLGKLQAGTGRMAPQLSLVDINSPEGESLSVGSLFLQLACAAEDLGAPVWRMLEPDGTLTQMDRSGRQVLLKGCGRGTVLLPEGGGGPAWLASDATYPGQADSLRVMVEGAQQWSTRDFLGDVVAAAASGNPSTSGWQALVLAVQEPEEVSRLYLLRR